MFKILSTNYWPFRHHLLHGFKMYVKLQRNPPFERVMIHPTLRELCAETQKWKSGRAIGEVQVQRWNNVNNE